MSKTYRLRQKYGPKHILHPFLFYCELCKGETHCSDCLEYAHHFCPTCVYYLTGD